MCAFCYRDAFAQLAVPYDKSLHMHRIARVPKHCRRCRDTGCFARVNLNYQRTKCFINTFASHVGPSLDGEGEFFPDELWDSTVERTICLPTDVLAAAAILVGKSGATAILGAKPPNDWLQIANLVAQGKHEADYAYALSTVGAWAITDEIQCAMPAITITECFIGIFESKEIGYAWQRIRGPELHYANTGCDGVEQAAALAVPVVAEVHFGPTSATLERPNVAQPEPALAPPPGLEQLAYEASEIDQQMGAHVDGGLLHSTVVVNEHGDHVRDNRTATGEIGTRTARSRFPKTSPVKEYLFSNDPENIVSAEAMRNQGVGVADLSPDQLKTFDEAVAALKKHLFTKNRCLKAERFVEKTTDVLPKNRSNTQCYQMHVDALNASGDEAVPFSLLVDAFTKKEVTKKPKPRPIANHGDARVWGMAKCAAIFEDVMFHNLPYACIKHEEKNVKMNELFSNLDGFDHKVENDLTAFEFGIHEKLKKAESDVLKHIMGYLDLDSDNAGFCHRVVNARTKACTWVLRYVDAAGAKCQLKIALPRSMRESGDRVTSSGNFLQNLLAWLTFLVKPGKVEAAIQSLIQHKGKMFYYTSARDGKQYKAFLAFEGDDTLGGINEKILATNGGQLVDEFFSDYGWKAKFKVADNAGDACIQFVGYTALLKGGAVVKEGANVVMFPEIKRILQDKPWSSTDIPDDEYYPSVAIYATCMANEFRHFGPMHAFFTAMRTDHIAKGGSVRRNNAMLRDIYIKMHGDVGTEEQVLNNVPDLEPFLDGSAAYQDLARVHAGDFTATEYASMCGVTTLEMHGRDLACFFPQAWLV